MTFKALLLEELGRGDGTASDLRWRLRGRKIPLRHRFWLVLWGPPVFELIQLVAAGKVARRDIRGGGHELAVVYGLVEKNEVSS